MAHWLRILMVLSPSPGPIYRYSYLLPGTVLVQYCSTVQAGGTGTVQYEYSTVQDCTVLGWLRTFPLVAPTVPLRPLVGPSQRTPWLD